MDCDYNTDRLNKFNRVRVYQLEMLLGKYGHLLKWKSKERILDIGCGTGDMTSKFIYPLLPKDFSQLLCTDISKDMVEAAQKLFKGTPKISYDILDISGDLDDGMKEKFDHIFSFYCLMWIKDQRKAFKNIYDLLSPDGECFLVIVDKHNFVDVIFEVLERPRWKKFNPNPFETYPHPYQRDPDTARTVREMMESIGFTNIKVYLEVSDFAFKDAEEFLGFFTALPNPMALMTAEEQKDYLNEAVEIAVKNDVILESGVNNKIGGCGTFMLVYANK